jgi:hypothetical protein
VAFTSLRDPAMRTLGILLIALTVLSVVPSIAAAADDVAYTRGLSPGNGTTELATAPPADLSGPVHNVSARLRALHPELLLAIFVGLLLAVALVLGVAMLRDAWRRSPPPGARAH